MTATEFEQHMKRAKAEGKKYVDADDYKKNVMYRKFKRESDPYQFSQFSPEELHALCNAFCDAAGM